MRTVLLWLDIEKSTLLTHFFLLDYAMALYVDGGCMTFSERMKTVFEQGLEASKDIAAKAGAKAQDLGEKGVLKVEILQLEAQAKKWVERLGAEACKAFIEQGQDSLSANDPVIKGIIGEINAVRDAIERKEAALSGKAG
jgi:hypothetical protein